MIINASERVEHNVEHAIEAVEVALSHAFQGDAAGKNDTRSKAASSDETETGDWDHCPPGALYMKNGQWMDADGSPVARVHGA